MNYGKIIINFKELQNFAVDGLRAAHQTMCILPMLLIQTVYPDSVLQLVPTIRFYKGEFHALEYFRSLPQVNELLNKSKMVTIKRKKISQLDKISSTVN